MEEKNFPKPALLSFGHTSSHTYVGLCACCGDTNNPNDEEVCKMCSILNPDFDEA